MTTRRQNHPTHEEISWLFGNTQLLLVVGTANSACGADAAPILGISMQRHMCLDGWIGRSDVVNGENNDMIQILQDRCREDDYLRNDSIVSGASYMFIRDATTS